MFLFVPVWMWSLLAAGVVGVVTISVWWRPHPGSFWATASRRYRVIFTAQMASISLMLAVPSALNVSGHNPVLDNFVLGAALLLFGVTIVCLFAWLNEASEGMVWWAMTWRWRERVQSITRRITTWVRLRREEARRQR